MTFQFFFLLFSFSSLSFVSVGGLVLSSGGAASGSVANTTNTAVPLNTTTTSVAAGNKRPRTLPTVSLGQVSTVRKLFCYY